MFKKTRKIGVTLLLLLGMILGAIYFYVKGHKEEVVNLIVDTISKNHQGSIHFDDVTLRVWGNFTNPAFYLKNVVVLDSSAQKSTRFEVENLYLNLSIRSLFKEKIQVKSLRIENFDYQSIIYEEDLAALTVKSDSLMEESFFSESFEPYNMSIDIKNFSFNTQNIPGHKKIKFKINQLASTVLVGPEKITASLDMDAHVSQLGFNLQKGSYLKDSKIHGTVHPEIDLVHKKVHIPAFDVSINDQIFKLTADFDTAKHDFLFTIVNNETAFAPTLGLISDHVQIKLNRFKIAKAFSTHTTIQGDFARFSNPLVRIDFRSVENSVVIDDRFNLDSLSFAGSFTNRIYDDERAKTEDKKDVKLLLNSLTGNYKETTFEVSNALLTSTPEEKAFVKGTIKADGAPEDLISFIKDPSVILKKGRFHLMGNLEGDATSAADLLSRSTISLKLTDTDIFDLEKQLSIPVKELELTIKEDRAKLELLKLPLVSSDDLSIYGEVSRFSSLLKKAPEHPASTSFHLKSDKLKWEDFMNYVESTKKEPQHTLKRPKDLLHHLVKKIYLKFDPTVAISIKEFEYDSLTLNSFSTGLAFSDENNVHLKNTTFEVDEGAVTLNASLDFEHPKQILLDAEIDITGTSEIFNTFFKSDTYIFKGGDFQLQGNVYGDILQMDYFLNALNGSIRLEKSNLTYQPNDLSFPIDLLDVQIKNNSAILNDLEIGLGTTDKLNFSGKLENFSGFLSSANTAGVNTFIDVHSSRVQWSDFIAFFNQEIKKEQTTKKTTANSRIKNNLRGIYSKFNPTIGVTIDTFEYKDLIVLDDFSTRIDFDNVNSLVLEESSFNYDKKTKVAFSATLDISESAGTNLDAHFKVLGDPQHLNKILSYNTFLLEGGEIEITAKISGDIEKTNELVSASSAHFKIENSTIIHNPSKARIPFSILEIAVEDNDAILKSMVIDLPSGDSIKLSGELDNITSIAPKISGNNKRMSSKLNIFSDKLHYSEFMVLFKDLENEKRKKSGSSKPALKAIVKDFYNKYQPELSIRINEFKFHKLLVNNFNTGFYFENENLLYLENTAFDFFKANVTLDAHLNITDPYKTEFSLGFTTDKLDLEKLLISFDYFNIPSIKEADKIDGKISIKTQLEGDLIDNKGLLTESLNGTIGFNLQDMQLKSFDPILKVGNVLFKKKRLENIRFDPIKNTLFVSNNTVEIPLMEIQSTALDFFISGHLGYGEVPTNLWTAIPLSNFKRRDSNTVPTKIGYAESGKKIYVEAKTGKKGTIKYKPHLSGKKYFKERELLSEYRLMVKENKLLRRRYKRESRMNKKI